MQVVQVRLVQTQSLLTWLSTSMRTTVVVSLWSCIKFFVFKLFEPLISFWKGEHGWLLWYNDSILFPPPHVWASESASWKLSISGVAVLPGTPGTDSVWGITISPGKSWVLASLTGWVEIDFGNGFRVFVGCPTDDLLWRVGNSWFLLHVWWLSSAYLWLEERVGWLHSS